MGEEVLTELHSPDQYRSVLMNKIICVRYRKIFINAAKSQKVLNMGRSVRTMWGLIPGANDSGNLIENQRRYTHNKYYFHCRLYSSSTTQT